MSITRLLVVNALIRLAAASSGQLFAFLMADRFSQRSELGAGLVGLLGAAFFLTELFGAPIAGRIADTRGQRRVLAQGPIFGAVCGTIAMLVARGSLDIRVVVVILVVARFTEGLSAACAVPTTLVLLSRSTEGNTSRRTRVMGLFEVTSLVAMIAGYAIAGIAWDSHGASSFALLPLIYALAWLLMDRKPEPKPSATTAKQSPLALVVSLAYDRGNIAFGVAWLAVNAVVGVWFQQAPYLLKLPEHSTTQALVGGATGREIGVVFSVWGATFLVGIGLWATFGAHLKKRRVLATSLFAMLGVVITLGLANIGWAPWALWIAPFFVLVEAGFTPAALAHLADITGAHDESRGAALGLYSLLLGSGQLLGNVMGAPFAARWQMNGILGLTAILATLALIAVAQMPKNGILTRQTTSSELNTLPQPAPDSHRELARSSTQKRFDRRLGCELLNRHRPRWIRMDGPSKVRKGQVALYRQRQLRDHLSCPRRHDRCSHYHP